MGRQVKIVGTELKTEVTLTNEDGEEVTYLVSVTYGSDAEIPENSYLEVTEYDTSDEKYEEARAAVITEKKNAHEVFDEDHLGFAALDITIKDEDGNEIEPAEGAEVKVSIQMKSLPSDTDEATIDSTMEVQHLNESTGEIVVEKVASSNDVTAEGGSATATFVTDSFSTYTITWSLPASSVSQANASFRLRYQTPNMWSQNAYSQNVRVWYVDESGNNIQKPTGRDDVSYNANNTQDVTINLSDYTELSGYTFVEARYSANTNNKPNGETIDKVQFTRTGTYSYTYSTNFINGDNTVATTSRTNTTNNDTGNVYLVYKSNNQRIITVHYGYMNGSEFVEFDSLPDGAQESYGAPTRYGDQLNVRYDISGKDYVTTYLGEPGGTQISPLLQTENSATYSQYPYWKYRVLNTPTVNNGINEWQRFTGDTDLYVVYRDTPTNQSGSSSGDTDPEDLGAPASEKNVDSNNDGTYDITLSVTGESNQSTQKSHANVVIVLDTSSSMDGTDTGVAGQTRLQAAKNAIYYLADQLFAMNTADDPNTIELAFVNFSHRVRNEQTMNTIYSGTSSASFKTMINGVNTNGGTNYDTAIEAANSILWNDADPTYVVFVTDGDTVSRGYLAYDAAGNTYPADWDGGTYYTAANEGNNNYLARARSAAALQVSKILAKGNKFYSIGVFGNVQYLSQIGGTYLGQANEDQKIRDAFATIISEIKSNLGYSDVTINDGITALTSVDLVSGDVNSFKYYRSGGTAEDGTTPKYSTTDNDGRGEEWTDIPESAKAYMLEVKSEDGATAYYKNGTKVSFSDLGSKLTEAEFLVKYPVGTKTVIWDINLGTDSDGNPVLLENGVKYTIAFTVWPSQEAYDLVADLNNGVKNYDVDLTDGERSQIKKLGTVPETYALKTNTNATVDYTAVHLENGEPVGDPTTGTSTIKDPNGQMVLDVEKMNVRKAFAHTINSEDPYTALTFYLMRDGEYYLKDGTTSTIEPSKTNPTKPSDDSADYYTVTLPKKSISECSSTTEFWSDENWSDEIYIAPGLMKNGKLLETGHQYSLFELITEGSEHEYEFTPQTVRPMNISSVDATYLILKDTYNTPTASATTYKIDDTTKTYVTPGTGDNNVYYVESEGNTAELVGTNRKTAELDITKYINDQTGKMTQTQKDRETFTYKVTLSVPATGDPSGIMGYEYVPRPDDSIPGTETNPRYNVYGYQSGQPGVAYSPANDNTKINGVTYGAWNSQLYQYFVSTHTEGTKIIVDRDANGNFTWLNGDGITSAKKDGDYYTMTFYVTINQNEVYRFNNLPSGTKYTIEEYYWNKIKADNASDSAAKVGLTDASNISASGFTVTVNASESTVSGNVASGTITKLDTRYYNQFVNTLTEEPAIVEMKVTKHLNGYNWSGERYYFRIEALDEDGTTPLPDGLPVTIEAQRYISKASGTDDGDYSFGHIRYSEEGTYEYRITELDPATAGIDAYKAVNGVSGYGATKKVTVTVEKQYGKLVVTKVEGTDTTFQSNVSNTTFTNTLARMVKLLKVGDGILATTLDDVEFELYEDEACTKKVTQDVLGNKIGDDNGVITTANGGKADIGVLKAGTYYLKETKTVSGYNLLTDLITITVQANGTVTYSQASYNASNQGPDLVYKNKTDDTEVYYSKIGGDTADQYANNEDYEFVGYRIIASNNSGVELPHTGGPGTLLYTLSGLALVCAAAMMYGFRMRRRERRSN